MNKNNIYSLYKKLLLIIFSLLLISCSSEVKSNSTENSNNQSNNEIIEENEISDNNVKREIIKEEVVTITKNSDYKKLSSDSSSVTTQAKKSEDKYYVGFYNIDETLLERYEMKYGDTPKFNGPTPTYSDNKYVYTFVGWSNSKNGSVVELTPIKGSAFFYAIYNKTEKQHEPTETPETTPSGCQNTGDLWYIVEYYTEERPVPIEGVELTYTEYVLKYKKYQYGEYGYVLSSEDLCSIESTNSPGSFEVGRYYHNGSANDPCSDPSSHNIH